MIATRKLQSHYVFSADADLSQYTLANRVWFAAATAICWGLLAIGDVRADDSPQTRPADSPAVADLIKKTGVAGGLCVFPRATKDDGKLALELAQKPSFVVHVISKDDKTVDQIRKDASDAGVLGKTFYVEKRNSTSLPFPNRLVDLLVVGDLADTDLTPEVRSEWLRVLTPRRGAALVGRAAPAGAGLSQDALKNWTRDVKPESPILTGNGLWTILKSDLPAGSDAWTHRLHGPESGQISADSTLQAPLLVQWWGLPRQEGFWGTTVVASNGRMFIIRSSRNGMTQVSMTARSLYNGIVLWQRDLSRTGPNGKALPHGGYVPGRSCAAAVADSLYLVDGSGILRLDAETGSQQSRIEGPASSGQIKWMAVVDKKLVMLSGEPDVMKNLSFQTVSNSPIGRDLMVYDLEQNKELWRENVPGDIDERMIVARDQYLYCLVPGVGLTSRDISTGKVVWTNADAELQTEFKTPEWSVIKEYLVSLPVLSALPEVLIMRAKWVKNTVAISRKDGKLLWRKPTEGGSYRGLTACAAGDVWIGGGKPLDIRTGEVTNGPTFIASGCGPTLSTPNLLVSCFGKVLDIKSNKVLRQEDLKSPCDVGSIVSDGMMVTMPSECGCPFEIKGYRALASAGNIAPHSAPAWKDRLTVLETAEPAAINVTAADWPAYRHDAQRSASSGATVGKLSKILWQWKPAGSVAYSSEYAFTLGQSLKPDHLSTAPIAADEYVWFGSPDGMIRCVKADGGKEVWSFATGSMLFKPPTLWQGRLLAGGGDGKVYCLDAQTGKCLWQLQVAPADRRVFWFGHMINTWPVMTGVAVQDGIAYAVAGHQKENGIHVYAFDSKTGNVIWENDKAGAEPGISSLGSMALSKETMFLPSGCFDLKKGDAKNMGRQFGAEVCVMDKWVLQCGRRIGEAENTLEKPLSASGIVMFGTDGKTGGASMTDVGGTLPAWDADNVLMPPKGGSGSLYLIPTDKFSGWLSEYPALFDAFNKAPKNAKPKLPEYSEIKSWATESIRPVSFALTKDQVVVAYVVGRSYKVSGYLRADGKKDWTIDLPDQPAMNRMAVDRNGRVLVSLCDGSVVCLGQ